VARLLETENMSRFVPGRDSAPILRAAEVWRDLSLKAGQSLFDSSTLLWTDQNIESLKVAFVDHPDLGEGAFLEKLNRQLRDSTPQVKQLAAEITWCMLLCPSNIGIANKRETIGDIWRWSGKPLPQNTPFFDDSVLNGIGSAGTAFNTGRWRELAFFILFAQAFIRLSRLEKEDLLSDGWKFAKWLESIDGSEIRQIRHMLLYLLFPDKFERIFGRSDRLKVVSGVRNIPLLQLRKKSPFEIDLLLSEIRVEAEREYGTSEVDFYKPPLSDRWWKEEPGESPSVPDESSAAGTAAELSRVDVIAALESIDRTGVPPDAESRIYDLVFGARRYPPKYVYSQAMREHTGEELPRSEFSGGESSVSTKILRSLGFDIETKAFVSELLNRFKKQADEEADLKYSDYPKSYRGIDVRVSFGKGNFSKVPWISFTSFGQSTNDGIYPLLLYFKGEGLMVVAYGISEETRPKATWRLPPGARTISTEFDSRGLGPPVRYGTSISHAVFDVSVALDESGIQLALDQVIAEYQEQFSAQVQGVSEPAPTAQKHTTYSIADATEGLFIEENIFSDLVALLRRKKNLILQGPPGVGKTFVCKRLAHAVIGSTAADHLQMVQFHQAYSYEDFVQGYRPSAAGFRLRNGLFFEFCQVARNDPAGNYVFIIDEINRGNLSKVLGEVMMLIEADKRKPEWALALAYSEPTDPKFYVPENVYLLGLMNTADRSIALVDYALRRRFAFSSLEPAFGSDLFWDYLTEAGAEESLIELIVERMGALNAEIAGDTSNLGKGFCVGHSFFCEFASGAKPDRPWYNQVIRTEIAPLLKEYYFDNPDKSESLLSELLR
jgi:5-methylcytosine-specific restriction protein B